ncbi:hypothetical protein ACOCEA_01350 [Maribacter sp. CXY002]|uniref:hypothetical protein n=1 Tax=Maribacter luteocoastalis TaxID=3407671 RepID=UPI003B674F69
MKHFIIRTVSLLLIGMAQVAYCQNTSGDKIEKSAYSIDLQNIKHIGSVDKHFQSYNIEMCEVIGGDFWVPYHLLDSVLQHTDKKGFEALKWKIEPIDLNEKKLRNLAAALGPAYIRVSGTWANSVYFQNNDAPILDRAPEGFNNVLTREQWKGVVDFSKAVNGKIVTSFAISDGMHDANGVYQVDQVKDLIDYTKSIGGEISAAEMFNEPTFASHGSAPEGYSAQSYADDFTIFHDFVSDYYPEMLIVGPGSVGEGGVLETGGVVNFDIATEDLMAKLPPNPFEVYSYHFYGGVSKRCGGKQNLESVMTQEWLSKTEKGLEFYQKSRDKYNPDAPIWLNETGEAACGGDPLAATFADTFRYLEQMGRLAKKGVKVVMHNTLARSEYALLEHDTHNPRPNYWAALLWGKLMGVEVYEAKNIAPGVNVYIHDNKEKTKGRSALIINATGSDFSFEIPSEAKQFLLTADSLDTKTVQLNGKVLELNPDDSLPNITGETVGAGTVQLPSQGIMFLSFEGI